MAGIAGHRKIFAKCLSRIGWDAVASSSNMATGLFSVACFKVRSHSVV